jgi:hypothetical protein
MMTFLENLHDGYASPDPVKAGALRFALHASRFALHASRFTLRASHFAWTKTWRRGFT